jgi:hypothetical protein
VWRYGCVEVYVMQRYGCVEVDSCKFLHKRDEKKITKYRVMKMSTLLHSPYLIMMTSIHRNT